MVLAGRGTAFRVGLLAAAREHARERKSRNRARVCGDKKLKNIKATNILLISDSCFSGTLSRGITFEPEDINGAIADNRLQKLQDIDRFATMFLKRISERGYLRPILCLIFVQ